MSLNFALLVTGPAYGTQTASTAYRFALSLVEQGHRLSHLFFYQEGVCNANGLHAPASDETDLVALWRELAIQQGIRIDVCVAAAMRRGVLDEQEAKGMGREHFNLEAPFCLSGLGQLAEAALTADRFVQF
ncbi:sulfurtransferase complex subunit TusD [Aeromonas caviae]|uniref:Sulfurtransferase TusD n=1 Tax=Aeromonas caviae TaxID=648 RepID=A0A2X4NI85_AERCA|nr:MULTISPECIES: sulfurtransferase complex subunit TusD [Aeromonas]PZQ93424.1 MAG: sulfurtransferase complex subunit TusD [Aeromonas media]AUT42460.1 sulfurtransferase TusD [Aeromonas sp. ASNIH5]AUY09628.1 sulfurtransferase TusD [Aeromonas sp. ASNIH2]KAB0677668.1 sulfurtransferase complex subunit TusD [Aeromonas caviae]KEP90210.1 sulfur transfer complex subunit TusD [Aeromonas caviae]